MGFIGNFWQGMTINIVEGLCNGNVAIVRTTVAEIVQDKKYVRSRLTVAHSNFLCLDRLLTTANRYLPRAFLLLPMSFNIAAIVGPVLGGQLAGLGTRFPDIYSQNWFLNRWPYAPPALANGVVMLISLLLVFLFLEEV